MPGNSFSSYILVQENLHNFNSDLLLLSVTSEIHKVTTYDHLKV